MRGPTIRPRGDENLSSKLGRTDDTIDILARRIGQQSSPKQSASGLPILGMADLRAAAGSLVAQTTSLDFEAVIYDAPTDPTTWDDGLDPSDWCSSAGYQITVEEGWYTVNVKIDFAWLNSADAPDSFAPYVQAGYDIPHQDNVVFPAATVTGRKGFQQFVGGGNPTYVKDPMHFELRWAGTAGTTGLCSLWDGSDPFVCWTIVKHT